MTGVPDGTLNAKRPSGPLRNSWRDAARAAPATGSRFGSRICPFTVTGVAGVATSEPTTAGAGGAVTVLARSDDGVRADQMRTRKMTGREVRNPPRISIRTSDIRSFTITGPLKGGKEKSFTAKV